MNGVKMCEEGRYRRERGIWMMFIRSATESVNARYWIW